VHLRSSATSSEYVRNVEVVGSSPITSTQNCRSEGLGGETGAERCGSLSTLYVCLFAFCTLGAWTLP
jgi:hypothetical protein